MKKMLSLLLALILIFACAACGASSASRGAVTEGQMAADGASSSDVNYGGTAAAEAPSSGEGETETAPAAGTAGQVQSDKIIYSGYAEVEALDFDTALAGVYTLIDSCGGFLESSSVTGDNYGSSGDARSADFVIRIPAERFEEVTGSLSKLGNVPYTSTDAENITTQYSDTRSRLDAYEVEYDRLMAMLEKAETVEEMLAVEERLSDVRYNIESLTNTLSAWDSQVAYSTLRLHLAEVREYTETPEAGYWQGVVNALSATLSAMGRFFKGLLRAIIAYSPVLVLLVALGAAVWLTVRRRRTKRAARPDSVGEDGEKKD